MTVKSKQSKNNVQIYSCIRYLQINKCIIFGMFMLSSACFHIHSNKLSPVLKLFSFLQLQCCAVVFYNVQTCLKYSRRFFNMFSYINIPSTMIFDAEYFSSRPFTNVYHSLRRFIIFFTKAGAQFNATIDITHHRSFLSGVNSSIISFAYSYVTAFK